MAYSKRLFKKMDRALRSFQVSTVLSHVSMNPMPHNHNSRLTQHIHKVRATSMGFKLLGFGGQLSKNTSNSHKSGGYGDGYEDEELEDIDLEFLLNNNDRENNSKFEQWCKDIDNRYVYFYLLLI